MNDIADLAQKIGLFLTPFLPYLLKAAKLSGTKAVEKVGEEFTEESLNQAKKLWKKLSHKDKVTTAAQTAADQPNNQAAQSAFIEAVVQALYADEKLQHDAIHIISKVKVGDVLADGKVTGVAVNKAKKKLHIDSDVETEDVSGKVTGVTFGG